MVKNEIILQVPKVKIVRNLYGLKVHSDKNAANCSVRISAGKI